MKPFPLPVVAFVGAGSQPEDPDLAYMPLPVQMDSFTMPALPSSEDIRHLNTALAVVGELAELAARWTPAAGSLSRSLAGLPAADLTLINQVLGEGEVSARALLADGGEVRIQESVFAGVWRMCTFNAAGEQTGDAVEIAPVPSVLIERAQASSRWLDSLPALPSTLMNAAPIGAELLARQRQALDHPHVINFTLLPVTPDDMAWIEGLIGEGQVGIFSRGYGKCRVLATALVHVWRVQYFNTMNTLLLDTLEITRIPDVTLADAEDIADSAERLAQAHGWLLGEFDHV